ncbi:hypothetical protein B0H17DRAFT_1209289 [Mycena rosella]|uniref:Secreted protein n=1 Tax=Mycena rosella TaxID=1033263 RepID=A0AAD7G5U1_MYCRO|nr:hypothetical protein B0H17DRAFT_1209289 [Mycena rosella]
MSCTITGVLILALLTRLLLLPPPPSSPHLLLSTSIRRKGDERSLGVPRLSRPTSPAQVPHSPCTLIAPLSRTLPFGPSTIHYHGPRTQAHYHALHFPLHSFPHPAHI